MLPEDAVVTWVTMPVSRWRERAYDHAEQLARAIAVLLNRPCLQLLTRHEPKGGLRHQVGLDRQERLENLKGSFVSAAPVSGTVILVDDVLTTGATAMQAAACLREAGAARVIFAAAAKSIPDD